VDLSIYRNGNFNFFFHTRNFRGDMHQVVFARESVASLRPLLRSMRLHHSPVTKMRMRGTRVYYGHGDMTFFYAWREQGRLYFVSSKYYGGIRPRDLRQMIATAAPLIAALRLATWRSPDATPRPDGGGATSVVVVDFPTGIM
jgi:hypothetical protein